jgi:hypothetical protein
VWFVAGRPAGGTLKPISGLSGNARSLYLLTGMSIPIFNLGRRDLPWSLLIAVTFAFIAILLFKGSTWTDDLLMQATTVACAFASSAFFGISMSKIFVGKGEFCPADEEAYESIEDPADATETYPRSNDCEGAQSRPQISSDKVQKSQEKNNAISSSHINTYAAMSTRSHEEIRINSTPTFQAPRMSPRDKDIDCGVEIAKALEDFEYNSIIHPKGSLRITRVHRDGVIEASLRFHFLVT